MNILQGDVDPTGRRGRGQRRFFRNPRGKHLHDRPGSPHGFGPGVIVGAQFPQGKIEFRGQQEDEKTAGKGQGAAQVPKL